MLKNVTYRLIQPNQTNRPIVTIKCLSLKGKLKTTKKETEASIFRKSSPTSMQICTETLYLKKISSTIWPLVTVYQKYQLNYITYSILIIRMHTF